MVYRWLDDVQEYDFTLEDILGTNYPVRDNFSLHTVGCPNGWLQLFSVDFLEPIPDYIRTLIGNVHNGPSDHNGDEHTLGTLTTPTGEDSKITLIKKKTHFLRSHIKQYIKNCAFCQKMRMIEVLIFTYSFTNMYLMEWVNIDFNGLYPDKGYVFVVKDLATEWVELCLSTEAIAKKAAEHLFQHFGRFGAPTQIQSDRRSYPTLSHIKQYIKNCEFCQKMSMIEVQILTHSFTNMYLMEWVNIDFNGLYPDKGYVFVVKDLATRWVELCLATEAIAKKAAEHLFQHFGRFGAPTQIQSDRRSYPTLSTMLWKNY
jgi:hypothetical protein